MLRKAEKLTVIYSFLRYNPYKLDCKISNRQREFGVGFVADGDEYAFDGDVFAAAVVEFQPRAGYAAIVAQYFFQYGFGF